MPEKTEQLTIDLSEVYSIAMAGATKQQLLASKVWAMVALGMWALFVYLFGALVAVSFDWATVGRLFLAGLLGWLFTSRIAPIQRVNMGGTDVRNQTEKSTS